MTPMAIPRWYVRLITTRSEHEYPCSWYPRDTCQLVSWTLLSVLYCFLAFVGGFLYGIACYAPIQGVIFSSVYFAIVAHIAMILLLPVTVGLWFGIVFFLDYLKAKRREAAYAKRELEGWQPVKEPEPSKLSLIYQSLRGKLCIPIQVKSNAPSTQGTDED